MTAYFGQMNQRIQADYAPINQASCKSCKSKIEKNELRIGRCMNDDHFSGKYWYHWIALRCRKDSRKLSLRQIHNIDQLDKEDFGRVVKYVEDEVERLNEGKKTKKTKQKAKSKQKNSKQLKKKKKNNKIKRILGLLFSNPSRKEQLKQAPQRPKPKRPKRKLYLQAVLKQKKQLAQRCADGEMLGKIPMCLECGGGKLRFDRQSATYKCPGFMDDDQFKNCNKLYTWSEIVRQRRIQP